MINKILTLTLIAITISFFSCKDQKKKVEAPSEKEVSSELPKTTESTTVPHHYICYTNDDKKSKKIWISFDENNKANRVKYEGQNQSIALQFNKEEYVEGGAHPTISEYYDEIYEGKVNGQYKLTHSGNWDYVNYIRGKDNKTFNFTIDHDADPYGNQPCF